MTENEPAPETIPPTTTAQPTSSARMRRGLWWVIVALAVIGAGIDGLLVWHVHAEDAALPGCSIGASSCDTVLQSSYGKVLDISLTLWALGFYAVLAVALWAARPRAEGRAAGIGSLFPPIVAVAGVMTGGWAVGVMLAVLKAICLWCLSIHVVNGLIFLLSLVYAWEDWLTGQNERKAAGLAPRGKGLALLAGAAMLAVAVGQAAFLLVFHERPKLEIESLPPRVFEMLRLESDEPIWTSKGPRNARNKIVIYECPTCPACRQASKWLDELLATRGDLRVDIRFFPLSPECNPAAVSKKESKGHRDACEFTRVILAVAKARPALFSEYLGWLYAPGERGSVTAEEARNEARKRVGAAAFDAAYDSPEVDRRLKSDVALAEQAEVKTRVPQLFIRAGRVTGNIHPSSLQRLVEENFGDEE